MLQSGVSVLRISPDQWVCSRSVWPHRSCLRSCKKRIKTGQACRLTHTYTHTHVLKYIITLHWPVVSVTPPTQPSTLNKCSWWEEKPPPIKHSDPHRHTHGEGWRKLEAGGPQTATRWRALWFTARSEAAVWVTSSLSLCQTGEAESMELL